MKLSAFRARFKKPPDISVSDEDVLEVVCPRCWADIHMRCFNMPGDSWDKSAHPHQQRTLKAISIAMDLGTLGYLPEHGPDR
jgi:hypothetical protein